MESRRRSPSPESSSAPGIEYRSQASQIKRSAPAKRSYGFRSYDVTTNALYHGMGNLPEPVFRHRFC